MQFAVIFVRPFPVSRKLSILFDSLQSMFDSNCVFVANFDTSHLGNDCD